ncbi:hypothetical protein D3C86_1159520 [compost metagenome]
MMPVPQRLPELAPEARPTPNLIELNTIKREPPRNPYVFKGEPPLPASHPKPFVFPDEVSDADAVELGKVHLFDFLTSGKPDLAANERPQADPWALLSEQLDQASDPEDVSTLLADLLTRLDTLAERRRLRLLRLLPVGAAAIPPLCIASALVAANLALTALSQNQALGVLAPWTPWGAALMAVPVGLTAASLLLGRRLRRVQPGEGLRLGGLKGRILASRPHEWLVQLENQSRRRIPYYLAAFASAERLDEGEEHA